MTAGQPIVEMAARLAPDDPSGPKNDLKNSIQASTKFKNTTGNADYFATMASGGTKKQAASAMHAARRAAKALGEGGSFAEIAIGPKSGRNSKVGSLQEFGTAHHAAQPFMRPAWAAKKGEALDIITRDLGSAIMKSAQRAAKKNAKKKG